MSEDVATLVEAEHEDPNARRVSSLISALLRWGVRASLLLFVIGTMVSFAIGSTSREPVSRLTGEASAFPRTARWLGHSLASGEGRGLIVLGLLVLIATPVLRVLLSLTVFAKQGDRAYVLITGVVLMLLAVSFILGKAQP